MKFVYPELSGQIISEDMCCVEWIIESPRLFSKYVQELYGQKNGKEGNFVLSEKDKILDVSKYVEIIVNPFSVNINDKKIVNKLYSQLSGLAVAEQNYLYTQEVMRMLEEYLLELEQQTEHILHLESQIDLQVLFKAAGIRHEIYEDNFIQMLSRYIKILCEVLKVKLIVFINIRSYLTDEEVQELVKEAVYQEIKILLIENQEKSCLKDTRRYIIDNDQCEIY